MKPEMEAFDRAVDMLGGINAFARAIGQKQSTVSNWRSREKVPAVYCPTIERMTGGKVKCEQLCPAAEWWVVRGLAKPKRG